MFSLKEKFKFLDDGIDFPFYKGIPKLSIAEWLLLFVAVTLLLIIIVSSALPQTIFPVAVCLVVLIPALYVCKGDYSIFFKKPKLRGFLTIILCLIGYYVYTFLILFILQSIGYTASGNAILSSFENPTVWLIVSTLLQLVGEEFLKILMLLIVMYVVYRFTNNRGLAIGLGVIISLSVFGLAHSKAYHGRLLQILLIQGFGSIFDLYAYMKTKNVVVSYILHVLIDYIPFITIMLGYVA